MFGTYLIRELSGRRRQTLIIAIGMGLAVGLVILVNGVSAGVRNAQSTVLQSIYGVGTDITISQPATQAAGNRGFDFGGAEGSEDAAAGSRTLARSRLDAAIGTVPFSVAAVSKARAVSGVTATSATLALQSTTFTGTIPTPGTAPGAHAGGGATTGGGTDGAGGSSFSVASFSVSGSDVSNQKIGPLTAVKVTAGRTLLASDAGKNVIVLDSAYAATASLAVGKTVAIAGTDFTVVGLVASTSTSASTASNSYIPLDVAQKLSGLTAQVSTIYVKAASASEIPRIQSALSTTLPKAKVSTQAQLASTVSGSLSTASGLVANLGLWLSALVLGAAFLIAILFTISGVTRRTREFGTLKAIGWSNARVVRQVAGESLIQGIIGGAVGIAIGLIGIAIVNAVAPRLSATTAVARTLPGGDGAGDRGFGRAAAALTTNITLNAPITISVILLAVGLAIAGGLLAGAIGGWRAARLRPAEALRSIA